MAMRTPPSSGSPASLVRVLIAVWAFSVRVSMSAPSFPSAMTLDEQLGSLHVCASGTFHRHSLLARTQPPTPSSRTLPFAAPERVSAAKAGVREPRAGGIGTVGVMTTRAALGMAFDRTFDPALVRHFVRSLDGKVGELWLIEDCFYTTAPPLAAAALAVTEELRVGLGILPARARTAAITAMEIATLAGLGPGRVVGGIGHGVQSWMGQMGVRPASPLTALDEVLTTVRRLLAGEEVSFQGRYVTLDQVQLDQPPAQPVPVLAGVRGPKSMALAGRSADGVVL